MNSVSKTLFIPLLGNIRTSKICPELFYDEKVLSLEKEVPLELRNKKGFNYFYFAGASRYFALDKEVRNFIKENKEVNIINLGAGFDTIFYRINDKNATFYEIDLAPVIEKRQALLGEEENDIYIKDSFLGVSSWSKKIKDKKKPTLFIASGLFYYFKREEINTFLSDVKGVFDKSEIVFDCVNEKALKVSNRFVKKTGNDNAPMYFYINDINSYLKQLNVEIELIEEYMMYRDTRKIVKKNGFYFSSFIMYISDMTKKVKIEHLRID